MLQLVARYASTCCILELTTFDSLGPDFVNLWTCRGNVTYGCNCVTVFFSVLQHVVPNCSLQVQLFQHLLCLWLSVQC